MNTNPPICKATKINGQPCQARTINGTNLCSAHSRKPKGMSAAQSKAEIPMLDLSTPESQRKAIELAIYRAQNGLENLAISRLVVYAVSVARQVGDDEIVKRLEALERANGISAP